MKEKIQRWEGIYLIGEPDNAGTLDSFLQRLEQILSTGIPLFQLRIKHREDLGDREHLKIALAVRELTRKWDTLFILNDRPDLAVLSDADGVHLGPSDLSVEDARKIVGRKIIGLSNHSYEEVLQNRDQDVDYFSIGPIFATDSKVIADPVVGLPVLERSLPHLQKPVVAIGGISLERLPRVAQTGVPLIGVIRGIWGAENPVETAGQYKILFKEHTRTGVGGRERKTSLYDQLDQPL